jgi:methanogenic corrinoid protein MtbC1
VTADFAAQIGADAYASNAPAAAEMAKKVLAAH